jgi:hypothetical protein
MLPTYRELKAVLITVFSLQEVFQNRLVKIYTDNQNVVNLRLIIPIDYFIPIATSGNDHQHISTRYSGYYNRNMVYKK